MQYHWKVGESKKSTDSSYEHHGRNHSLPMWLHLNIDITTTHHTSSLHLRVSTEASTAAVVPNAAPVAVREDAAAAVATHLSNPLTNHRPRDQMAASQQKGRFAHGVQVCSMVTNRKPTRYKQQTHISPLTSAVCYCILHPQFPSLYVGKLSWHTESPRLSCDTTKWSLVARGPGNSSSH